MILELGKMELTGRGEDRLLTMSPQRLRFFALPNSATRLFRWAGHSRRVYAGSANACAIATGVYINYSPMKSPQRNASILLLCLVLLIPGVYALAQQKKRD